MPESPQLLRDAASLLSRLVPSMSHSSLCLPSSAWNALPFAYPSLLFFSEVIWVYVIFRDVFISGNVRFLFFSHGTWHPSKPM